MSSKKSSKKRFFIPFKFEKKEIPVEDKTFIVKDLYKQYKSLAEYNGIKMLEIEDVETLQTEKFKAGAKKTVYTVKGREDLLYVSLTTKEIMFSLNIGIAWLKNKDKYNFFIPILYHIDFDKKYLYEFKGEKDYAYPVLMEKVKFDFQLKSISGSIFVQFYIPEPHIFDKEEGILSSKSLQKDRIELLVSYTESVIDFNYMTEINNISCSEYETLVKLEKEYFKFYAIDFEHCFENKNYEDYIEDLGHVKKMVGFANWILKPSLYKNLTRNRTLYLKGKMNEEEYNIFHDEFVDELEQKIEDIQTYESIFKRDNIDETKNMIKYGVKEDLEYYFTGKDNGRRIKRKL